MVVVGCGGGGSGSFGGGGGDYGGGGEYGGGGSGGGDSGIEVGALVVTAFVRVAVVIVVRAL